jgi:hypothetical protein
MQINYTTSPTKSQPIFCGSRVIGQVTGDVFYKVISGSKHFLRQPPAIAFDISTLDDAENVGARLLEVKDRETGRVYRASLALVRSVGFPVNRGFGNQVGVNLGYFSVDGQPPRNTPTKAQPFAEVQPRLF